MNTNNPFVFKKFREQSTNLFQVLLNRACEKDASAYNKKCYKQLNDYKEEKSLSSRNQEVIEENSKQEANSISTLSNKTDSTEIYTKNYNCKILLFLVKEL